MILVNIFSLPDGIKYATPIISVIEIKGINMHNTCKIGETVPKPGPKKIGVNIGATQTRPTNIGKHTTIE